MNKESIESKKTIKKALKELKDNKAILYTRKVIEESINENKKNI